MTKKEEILNNTTGLEDDYGYELYSRGLVEDMMEKYGKYCAEQAWREAIQQHSMLSLSNMVNGGFVMKSLDEWWSEFQRKDATE